MHKHTHTHSCSDGSNGLHGLKGPPVVRVVQQLHYRTLQGEVGRWERGEGEEGEKGGGEGEGKGK